MPNAAEDAALLHPWWELEVVQPLWKIEKQLGMFLKKNNEIFNSYMAQEPSNCIHTAPN